MTLNLTFTFAGDESGDTSFKFEKGASRYFVIAMIATDQPDEIRTRLQEIKNELHLPEVYEYKYHKLKGKKRGIEIVSQIACLDFKAWAIIVDKTSLDDSFIFLKGLDFYLYFVTELIRGIPMEEKFGATLILDEFGARSSVAVAARKAMRIRNISSGFKRIISRNSASEPLIQLADLVAGGIAHRDSVNGADMASVLQTKLKSIIEYPYPK